MYPLHSNGAIVRIKLKDFLTYSAVELYPGPYLNMVVGPNGTGKSTVVCAIALGLGGRPEVLGRAREIQDFVKHGENKAMVEIELKVAEGRLVITRTFERGSNHSTWKINGHTAKEKDVKAEIEALAIQVDNLCQFLAQERVSGFAQLGPSELLRETERAAGGSQMVEWHNYLIEQRDKEVTQAAKLRESLADLEVLQKRNQQIEHDVQRIKERDMINKEIRMLNVRLAKLDFTCRQADYRIAKDAKQRLQEECVALAHREQPLRAEQERLRRKVADLEKTVQDHKTGYSHEAGRCRTLVEEAEAKSDEIETILNDAQHAKSERLKQKREMERLEATIVSICQSLDEQRQKLAEYGITPGDRHGQFVEPPLSGSNDGDTSDSPANLLSRLHQQVTSCSRRISENADRMQHNSHRKDEVAREAAQIRHQQQQKTTELSQLDQVRHRKLAALKRGDRDAYDATMWLQEHSHLFEKHVFEPICMEVNLKDIRYASIMESLIKPGHNTTFVTQCQKDYKRFCEEVITQRKWRVNVVYFDRTLASWTPEHPRHVIMDLGFDGYALDFIDGPEPILSALCQMAFLHTNPVALGKLPNMVAAEKMLQVFIADNDIYSVKRAYGHSSTRAKRVVNPRYLDLSDSRLIFGMTIQLMLNSKTRLEREHEEIMSQLFAIQEVSKELELESSKIREIDLQLRDEKAGLHQQRVKLNTIKQEYTKQATLLQTRQDALAAARANAESTNRPDSNAIDARLMTVCEERARLAIRLSAVYEASTDIFLQRTKATLVKMQATARIEDLEVEIMTGNEQGAESVRALELAKQDLQNAKTLCRTALNRHNAEVEKLSAAEAEELDGHEETLTSDDIAGKMGALVTRAEIISRLDPSVLDHYEARLKEIEKLSESIHEREEALALLSTTMQETKDRWTLSLQNIVQRISEKFSDSFETLGCAGEVLVVQNDDYSKWGIEIRVKFRDNEPLQVLTATRQSGGERSVSTMLYLIALQHLSMSPFRVVDEINQGMDPRNERNVHKLIVQAACRKDDTGDLHAMVPSQYFLITPKLLHDLEYHRNMTVLCIYNGAWQPKSLDLAAYIAKRSASQ
ncbi:hypothetical protein BASA61_003584 [Batrachochytrium salamandrivorans]|nr:hypothetical protein BASA61_003584 [Batrachochytrium salamandrivorans]